MNSPATIRDLDELARQAVDPKPLEHFINLIENDYGYEIYRAVSDLKVRLSSQRMSELHFKADDFEIRTDITRNDFENWIADDVRQIEQSVQQAVDKAELETSSIDRVFLTGGTSFVPVIRTVFESKARIAMAPMQDVLGLDDWATMNRPGTVGGNWLWRMKAGAATPEIAKKLKKLNKECKRGE